MPIDVRFFADRDYFEVEFTGVVEESDVAEMCHGLFERPEWGRGKARLNFFRRGSDLSGITFEALQRVIGSLNEKMRATGSIPQKAAWVVQSPSVRPIIGLWQLLPDVSGFADVQIFDTEQEARAWLEEDRLPAHKQD